MTYALTPLPRVARSTVHTLPVFSPDVALSIALDAQAVAAKQGVTCRGASLKGRIPAFCVGGRGRHTPS